MSKGAKIKYSEMVYQMTTNPNDLDGFVGEGGARATGQRVCRICLRDPKRRFGECRFALVTEREVESWTKMIDILAVEGDPREVAMRERFVEKLREREEHLRATSTVRKTRKHAGHELGAREFTLTYSPKWFDDATARTLMIRAIERLSRYYRNQIEEFECVGETGKNGASHIHGYYLLKGGKKMTDKNFKRAWERWNPHKKQGAGHEGGHHALVQNESDFKGYIDKEKNPWYRYTHNATRSEEGTEEGSEEGSEEDAEDAPDTERE